MGDENPIRTLGDYFKPSYDGYRNTIELLVRNNVEHEVTKERSMKSNAIEYINHEMKVEEEVKEETEEETKEEEKENLDHFDTYPTMNELRYHEWLLNNPRPSWVKDKIKTRDVNNVKFSNMIG
nr:hypothetical protein [Tanacetum cinerariifolium]